jgi:hypothetical protein
MQGGGWECRGVGGSVGGWVGVWVGGCEYRGWVGV